MTDASVLLALAAVAALLLALVALVVALRASRGAAAAGPALAQLTDRLAELRGRHDTASERIERELRQAVTLAASEVRTETGARIGELHTGLLNQMAGLAAAQTTQLAAFGEQVARIGAGAEQTGRANREEAAHQLGAFGAAMQQQFAELARSIQTNLSEVRATLSTQLAALQQGNEAKLDQMRATVEEKLQSTLDARLGESFRHVADRLEQVHRGLGEMQGLAQGVGDLKRVLSNVKARGSFGEVQLAALLEQVLTAGQYAANVATRPDSSERVEFAVRMPGRGAGEGIDAPLWLPIDAKFPREDYERLLEAHERADAAGVETAAKAIETRLRLEARTIRDKYVAPPHTTDFAILYLPVEGLYAEALRRPGLAEALQREWRVSLAGPTTLAAMLNSLQMGFRTLAIEQRSAEVWAVLGAVKSEFGKFGEALAHTKKKLEEASSSIGKAETRTRVLTRKLKEVEALPAADGERLIGAVDFDADEE